MQIRLDKPTLRLLQKLRKLTKARMSVTSHANTLLLWGVNRELMRFKDGENKNHPI